MDYKALEIFVLIVIEYTDKTITYYYTESFIEIETLVVSLFVFEISVDASHLACTFSSSSS